MLVNKKCTNIARASKNFKPAARRVKKIDEPEQSEVEQVEIEVSVESEIIAKDEEL